MMGPGEVMGLAIVATALTTFVTYMARRFFALKEKQLEIESRLAAEKAAQYAASNAQLEARLRVLEQIVTDGGMQTAAQIEALREKPQLPEGDKVQ